MIFVEKLRKLIPGKYLFCTKNYKNIYIFLSYAYISFFVRVWVIN